jgi:hypothetical protein
MVIVIPTKAGTHAHNVMAGLDQFKPANDELSRHG